MHEEFASWYQPVSFGHESETLGLRWQGVEETLSELNFSMTSDLIRLVINRQPQSPETVTQFRQYFKNTDPTFLTSGQGNELEVKILAGSVLALACVGENHTLDTALSLLTASACGLRTLNLEKIDLIGMATDRIRKEGASARARPKMTVPQRYGSAKSFEGNSKSLTQNQDLPHLISAINNVRSTVIKLLNSIQNAVGGEIINLQKRLNVQDEELQLLWWVVGKWSKKWECTFDELDGKALPILLGTEAVDLTTCYAEPASLRAIFSRVGIGEADLTIPDAINACGRKRLEELCWNEAVCATIFPLHNALARARETGADSTWKGPWKKVSGISANRKVSPLKIAMQIYRERNLLNYIENSGA